MSSSANARAALHAATRQFTHRSTSTPQPGSRGMEYRTTDYTESPSPAEVLEIADTYLRWLEEAEKGTLEERVSKLEGER